MDASQVQSWVHGVRPTSATAQEASFEDLPLTPLHDEGRSSVSAGGFPHAPLEHEVVASGSAWDDVGAADELCGRRVGVSSQVLGGNSPVARGGTIEEFSTERIVGKADCGLEALRRPGPEKAVPTEAVLELGSDCADVLLSETVSAVASGQTPVVLDSTSGSTVASSHGLSSAGSGRDHSWSPPTTESDISDEHSKFPKSEEPAGPTISVPSARMITHADFPRVEKPATPTSIPEYFEIPIPLFPFPAGTSRCKHRNCPIKGRHEQGPYLHEGKLRTREGSIFGSSNPPPEIWFLYDLSGKEDNVQGMGDKAFAPVELFVKYHFGETEGEGCCGSLEAGGKVQRGAKLGGKRFRSWRIWR